MLSIRGRRPRLTLAILVAVFALAGCAGGSPGSQSSDTNGSAGSQSLVIYSGRSEELVGPLIDEFSAEESVDVDVRYGDTAELAAQILEEGDRSPAQVFFSQDAGALQALEEAGLLVELPKKLQKKVDEIYRSRAGQWIGVSGRARVLLYNSDLVPADEVPTSVFELTDPKWKGQVGIAPTNASFQSFVTAMRIAEGDEKTQQWLDAMVANDVQTFENNSAIRDAVDAAQIELGLANHYYWYEKADEVGAENLKVQNTFLAAGDPGSLVNVAGAAVLASGADNPAAMEFISFLLSKNSQEYFAEETAEYPLVAGVEQADGLPPLETVQGPDIELGQLSDLATTQQMLQNAGLL